MGGWADWFFRDRKTGAIVIGQWPNLSLWLFTGFVVARAFAEATSADLPGPTLTVLRLAAQVCLTWWALDELCRGVNPWRRCIGGAVLIVIIWIGVTAGLSVNL